jgi:lipopolysaccharide transport system ATP-binding protein
MSDSDTVISVQSLSKRYLVGHEGPQERYHSLRDTVVRHGKNFLRKTVDMAKGKQIIQGDTVEEFWALKDVSFEVKRGEVLGIIGRNGAGKSTLLKILSRITEPTSGRVTLRGRVASLLEVGTGFHPELTGRENIFLNGAILGMSRAEIKTKFNEIVDFAGVEKFLDTPVKRYSSGMYVRLAFAVAAHLEPEILIVDEVLAVGDAEFQKKCLGKMQDVAKGGRTVIFVSHNLQAMNQLCDRAIMLEQGAIRCSGPVQETISQYLTKELQDKDLIAHTENPIKKVKMSKTGGDAVNVLRFGQPFSVEMSIENRTKMNSPEVGFSINSTKDGRRVFGSTTRLCDVDMGSSRKVMKIEVIFEQVFLSPGGYTLDIGLIDAGVELEFLREAQTFVVAGDENMPIMNPSVDVGVCIFPHHWKVA